MIFTILDWVSKMPNLAFLIEIVSVSIFPQMPKYATDILGAYLNTSRATEMLFNNLEFPDVRRQNVVYYIIISSLLLLQSRERFCIVLWNSPAVEESSRPCVGRYSLGNISLLRE